MRWADKFRLRLRSLFRRAEVERELDSELRFHLEQQIQENLAAGMPPDEAQYAALRKGAARDSQVGRNGDRGVYCTNTARGH